MSISLLLLTVCNSPLAEDPRTRAERRPRNVVVFLADDLGIETLGCYGGVSYATPHVDRLAAAGTRFNNCFSNPLCSPSRGELLTGREPLHTGIPRVIFDPAQHREFMNPAEQTSIANLYRQAGYETAMTGKWQLSFLHERDTINAFGFKEYQAWQIFRAGQKTSRFASPSLRRDGELKPVVRGGYGPDENLRFVKEFITRHRAESFFIYYACLLPHWPWEPTPNSNDSLSAAEGVGDAKYFPDMVSYLDTIVGRLVTHLDETGLRDDTLLLFVADNGTDKRLTSQWADQTRRVSVSGGKGTMTDAGTHVPLIVNWPGHVPAGTCDDLVELCDVFPTLQEVSDLPSSQNAVNGVSFAPQIGLASRDPQPRDWIHAQNNSSRHVRSSEYILNNAGKLRPVVGIGEPAAASITRTLTGDERAAKRKLEQAMKTVEAIESPSGRP